MKLNLGCGKNKLDGYVNIDCHPSAMADKLFDLESYNWPWLNNSADDIQAIHVMEHIGETPRNFLRIIKNIHRILKPNATITIKTPHHRCDSYWGDPTHVRPVTPAMMNLFSKKNCEQYIANGWPNTPLAEYLDIDLEIQSVNYALTQHWAKQLQEGKITQSELDYAVATHWNVVDEVTMVLRKIG